MEKRAMFIMGALVLILVIVGIYTMSRNGNASGDGSESGTKKVSLETTEGKIVIELYVDKPITAGNFEKLVSEGFYDGVIFHRVMDGFMIQGGDPTGTGMGGPEYSIKDEFSGTSSDENNRGTISMANSGANTGGSQFFINLIDNNFLDGKHPVFGKVVEGMDVVDKIGKTKTDSNDKPVKTIEIVKAKVI